MRTGLSPVELSVLIIPFRDTKVNEKKENGTENRFGEMNKHEEIRGKYDCMR